MKDLVEMKKMLKSTSKNIIPSPRYNFLKIAICLYLQNAKNFQLQCPKIASMYLLERTTTQKSWNLVYMFLGWVSTKVMLGFEIFRFLLILQAKTVLKWQPYWIFELFWPVTLAKIKFFLIPTSRL